MRLKNVIRSLLLAEVFCILASAAAWWFTQGLLPEELQAFEHRQAAALTTSEEWLYLTIAALFLNAYIVAASGLYLFWRHARTLYLLKTLSGVLAYAKY